MSPSTRLSLFLGSFFAGCVTGPLDDTACLTVTLGDDCPSEGDASAQLVGNGTCDGGPVRKIAAIGSLVSEEDGFEGYGGFQPDSDTAQTPPLDSEAVTQCCYEAAYRRPLGGGSCISGRPVRVDGRAVSACAELRSDWARGPTPDLSGLSLEARLTLAGAWTEAALSEHASIPAFARVVLDLVALGAPPELIARTSAAIADETRHAEVCFALASAYGDAPVGPGRLPVPARRRASLRRLAVETFREGCVGETLAVALAAAQLRDATDPAVRAVLAGILDDEARHAELAWDTVRWAIRVGGAPVRRAVEQEMARLEVPAVSDVHPPGTQAHGLPDAKTSMAALRGVMDEVIGPSVADLLAA